RINICKIPLFGDIAIRCFNAFAGAAVYMAVEKHERMDEKVKAGFLAPYNNY
ncbi:MAG TPA: alpha/beta hydrolase, partial [Candidatus Wallbacteria bacterium]|nr:alpha/beta hydrolase [Candidatus Wallbacteria bacterium]